MDNKRPKLSEAVRYFKDVYDHVGGDIPAAGKLLGGKLDYNINHIPDVDRRFKNLCAVRLSYVLNKTGFKVPFITGESVSAKDGSWYIYRVTTMTDHLTKLFGKPDMSLVAPTPEKLAGHQGIIVFEVDGWGDATGHATVWNGANCSDKCYFTKAKKIHLWILKD